MFGAFAMRFLLKSVFFTRLAPVSRPGVFFLRLGHLRLVQVYLFYACVEIGLVRLLRVYFLTRTLCIFFGKCIFGLHLWKQKSHFCCKCILAAHVFLRSSVLLIVLRWLESLPGLGNSTPRAAQMAAKTMFPEIHLCQGATKSSNQVLM